MSDSELEGAVGGVRAAPNVGSSSRLAASLGEVVASESTAANPGPISKEGSSSNGLAVLNEEEDLAGTCAVIVKMVDTCNWQMPFLSIAARSIVEDMNLRVMSIIKGRRRTDFQGDDSSDNSDDEPPVRIKPEIRKPNVSVNSDRRKPVNHNISGHSAVSVDQLADILSRFDKRTVPKPEPFDIASGHNFVDFLALFEEYCTNSFCGSSKLWVGELGRLLNGDMAVAFNALRSPSDSYEDIKTKLCKWHSESGDLRVKERKRVFSEATRNAGETTRLYAARLERLFKLAYPRKNVDSSSTLRDKFFKTVPPTLQQQISMMRNVGLSMQQSNITWSTVIVLAGAFDKEHSTPVYDVGSSVFVGAVASRSSVADAVTQYDGQGNAGLYVDQTERLPRSMGRQDQSGHNRNRRSASRNKVCFHCKKVGHIKEECWRFNGLCLACGSADHVISKCPSREKLLQSSNKMLKGSDSYKPKVHYVGADSGGTTTQFTDLSRPPPGYQPVSNFDIGPDHSGRPLN